MKTTARDRRNGFSLIEMIIAIVVLSIVILTVYTILINSTFTFTNMTRLGDLQDRARQVTDAMSKEMRAADIYTKFSLNAGTSANQISFRVPKKVNATSGAVVWSDSADTFNPYPAGDPYRYPLTSTTSEALLVCYRLETSNIDANNDGTKDKRLVRVFLDPITLADKPGTLHVLTDYLVAPGGSVPSVFSRGTDNTVAVNLTFLVADSRNKVLQRQIVSSISLRNNSGP